MKIYRIIEEWPKFKKFMVTELKHVNKDAIGIMYNDNEIYIRSNDETILEIVRQHYDLRACEQPANFLDRDDKWNYHNQSFFPPKI